MDDWEKFKNKLIGVKGLVSIGISDLIGAGISALFWFYIASLIETNKFGQIHYFLGVAGTSYSVALFGAQTVITIYVSKNLKLEGTLYFMSFLASSLASFVVFFIFFKIDVSLILIAYVINDLAIGYLLGKKLYTKYAKYVILQKILTLTIGITAYYVAGADAIIFGLFLSYLPLSIIIIRGFKETKIDFSLLKGKWKFIISNYVLNLAGISRGHIDKLVIGHLLGFSVLGNYILATQVFLVLMTFSTVSTKYLLPEYSTANANKKLNKAIMLLSILIAVLGITVSPYVIEIIFPKFIQSVDLIKIMSINVVSATIGQIYSTKMLSMEKSRHVLIGRWLSAGIMLGGIVAFGSIFGTIGLALAFLSSTTAYAAYLVVITKREKTDLA